MMFISQKRWQSLEKRIADLEVQVQRQQEAMMAHMDDHENENHELKAVLENLKNEVYMGVQRIMGEIIETELS